MESIGNHKSKVRSLIIGTCSFIHKTVNTEKNGGFSETGHPELTSNKMAQIWNNLQLNNAKSIADVRASALEWYRTNLQN